MTDVRAALPPLMVGLKTLAESMRRSATSLEPVVGRLAPELPALVGESRRAATGAGEVMDAVKDFGLIRSKLNQARVAKPTVLNDGDEIMIGGQGHVFCQPVACEGEAAESMASTAVVVAKTGCWMLLLAVPEPAGPEALDWVERVRATLVAAGAGVKILRGATTFVRWRMEAAVRDDVRAALLEIADRERPPGVRLALHAGTVRVGAGTGTGGENLLGADVAFVHALDTAAGELRVGLVASEPAVRSLDLAAQARPLGVHPVRAAPGVHALFTF